ncbi:DUF4097 family beta strand repeat-containing protein [Streptomyces sp. ACA25]|uniref:DUF4097 family beta strand repeat-containing protein n=1 Tax=Streptomyces sp. ACA25 TaxID=3022596 RepID=UPI002306FDDE|nr:DUF4097 family beta strand repeat-containing protein [Streptomyces sp. ACA25]MDB1087567.1 DUF4097 family beta strand repeat-containing protein [Streptomyces sp. ACA25]
MAKTSEWQITAPRTLEFDAQTIGELDIRVVNGAVNVVGTDGPQARVEVSALDGPALRVRHTGNRLEVGYDDLPWQGFLKWLDRKAWNRRVVVSVSVPSAVRLSLASVGAPCVVSGIDGPAAVQGVSGDTTLVGLTGPVRADTVTGKVEAQALGGPLRFNSVSGDLTLIDCAAPSVRADLVSGGAVLDFAPGGKPVDLRLNTVSGDVAVRLPEPADTAVEAGTAGGSVSSAFDELSTSGGWGSRRLSGTLGNGGGSVRINSVSGAIAVLRRPDNPPEDFSTPPPTSPSLRKDV